MHVYSKLAMALAVCAGMAVPAQAQTWQKVYEGETGSIFYIDASSIRRTGDVVRFWNLTDSRNNLHLEYDDPVASRSLEEIDCRRGRIRLL